MNDFLFYNNGRQKRAYFCTLVYTLTIYIGFKDNVNFDVILRVKFEPHIQELINYKGALESARIGPVSPGQDVMRHFVALLHCVPSVPLSLHIIQHFPPYLCMSVC